MNVTDLLLQMTYAAGQIAQNTLPGGGAAGQSGGRSDFQSLLEDKRAEAGQTPETPAERPAEDLERPVQDQPSQGETQEEYALVQSAALFLMPTLQMPAQVQPAPETGNGMQTAELGGISGPPVPLPAEAGGVPPVPLAAEASAAVADKIRNRHFLFWECRFFEKFFLIELLRAGHTTPANQKGGLYYGSCKQGN